MNSLLAKDLFLTEVLGLSTWNLLAPGVSEEWATEVKKVSAEFVVSRCSTADFTLSQWHQDRGFILMDTNVSFELPTEREFNTNLPLGIEFGKVSASQENQVVDLAEKAYRFSRFHSDPRVGIQKANLIQKEWTRNFFKGKRGDHLFVAVENGRVIGSMTVLRKMDFWIIDLICVDSNSSGRGIAAGLIQKAREVLPVAKKGWRVGTQISNLPAIRLYEKVGFRLIQSDYVFHYWRAER